MKNNKGFTLIELMGVIVLLGVIALIAIPTIDKKIKEAKNSMSDASLKSIKQASRLWASDNQFSLPADPTTSYYSQEDSNGYYCYINYSTLVESGYLEEDMKDPKSNVEFNEHNTLVKIVRDKNYAKNDFIVEYDKEATETNNSLKKGVECGDTYSALDDMVLWYDGINNTGNGHDASTTIWTDLSGNGNDGVISGTDTLKWNDNNFETNKLETVMTPWKFEDSHTILVTFKPLEFYNYNTVFDNSLTSDDNEAWIYSSARFAWRSIRTGLNMSKDDLILNAFTYFVTVIDNNLNTTTAYINDDYKQSENGNINLNGGNLAFNGSKNTKGKNMYYSMKVYNRALTEEEVKHNYEIDKLRFGF